MILQIKNTFNIKSKGLRIHKACWCKQHNFPIGKCKSIDGVMNLDYTHSIQDPIVK